MDADQPPARPERARQRRQHLLRLELDRGAGAIGLRGDDQIVIGARDAALRPHRVEQELVVLAVEHQHHRLLVDRVAAGLAHLGPPVPAQEGLELGDLPLEFMRGAAGQSDLVPHHAGRGVDRIRRQPGRLGIVHVGEDEHGGRMLEQAVRHLFEREAHVLEADFLADDVVRRGGEAVVERAHDAFEHGAVADAGVEHAHARRARMDAGDFEPDALGHHPFLAAGVDEEEIFLAVVEEAEILVGGCGVRSRGSGGCGACAVDRRGFGRGCRFAGALVPADEVAHPLHGFDRDAAAEAQAADELAVIDGEAAESGFRHAHAPAITRDFLQQRLAVQIFVPSPQIRLVLVADFSRREGLGQPQSRPLYRWAGTWAISH